MDKRVQTRFLSDSNGNLSITTGVVGLLLMTAVGATLDGTRMFSTKQSLQSVSDAAALMAATPEGISDAKRKAIARSSIANHMEMIHKYEISSTDIEVRGRGEEVYVSLTAEMPMMFGGLLGKDKGIVRASSLTEETKSQSSMSALSVSVVMDTSSSMNERFDRGSKIANVKAALSEFLANAEAQAGGPELAKSQISSGVYGFNWGQDDAESVTLEPGINAVKDSLVNIALSEGSVPTTAFEAALEDQLEHRQKTGSRDQYIVYLTDDRVDDGKSDQKGQYLPEWMILETGRTFECKGSIEALEEAYVDLDDAIRLNSTNGPQSNDTNSGNGANDVWCNLHGKMHPMDHSTLPGSPLLAGTTSDVVGTVSGLTGSLLGGGTAGVPEEKIEAVRVAEMDYIETCRPRQTVRVVEACQKAREENISLINIDMSGTAEKSHSVMQMCLMDRLQTSRRPLGRAFRPFRERSEAPTNALKTTELDNGLEVSVSEDGKSISAAVSDLDDLRHLLNTMLPENGPGKRTVRLVR
jgi:Flp pilus assembly protein TadG